MAASSSTIGTLRALLTLDSAQFEAGVRKTDTSLNNLGRRMTLTERATRQLDSAFKQVFAGFTAATIVDRLATSFLNLASEASKLPAISGSFNRLSESIGQSGEAMLAVTRTATKGLITDLDIMQSANKAMLLGLPVTASEMGNLSKAAVTLGKAMGQDATKSLDDLITALGRSSPLILDNLGLTVKVGEANEAYARSLGKSASELTDAERKMAFYVAAMEAAERKTEELGDITLTATDQFTRLGNAIANVTMALISGANESRGFAGLIGIAAGAVERFKANLDDLNTAARRLGGDGLGDFLLNPLRAVELQAEAVRLQIERLTDIAAERAPKLQMPSPLIVAGPTTAEIKAIEESSKRLEEQFRRQAEAAKRAAEAQKEWLESVRVRTEALQNLVLGVSHVVTAEGQWVTHMQQNLIPTLQKANDSALLMADGTLPAFRDAATEAALAAAQFGPEVEASVEIANASQTIAKATTFWEKFGVSATDTLETLRTAISGSFAQMMLGAKGFKDGFLDIWRSIKSAVVRIFAEIADAFISGMLKRMIAAMAGQSVAGALFGAGAGVAAGAGAAAATGGAAAAAGGAGGAAAAGGGGALGGLGAFFTNPWTIGIGAGALGIGLLIRAGVGRGGWEGVEGNKRRDQLWLRNFGGSSAADASMRGAAWLTANGAGDGGGAIWRAIQRADSKKEYESAVAALVAFGAQHGKTIKPFSIGGFVPPGVTQLAMVHGGAFGEDIVPRTRGSESGGGGRIVHVTAQFHSLDPRTGAQIFRDQFIPQLKFMLVNDTDGIGTAINKSNRSFQRAGA